MAYAPVVAPPPPGAPMLMYAQPSGAAPAAPAPAGDTDPYIASVVLLQQGAIQFNGSTYMAIPDSTNWDFPGDFTVEARINFTAHTTINTLVGNYQGATSGWTFQRRSDTNALSFGYGDTTLISHVWAPTDGVTYHLAVSRVSSTLRLFVDGAQLGGSATSATSLSGSSNPLLVGALYFGGYRQQLNGVVHAVRLTKGVGRYTGAFTPPTNFPTT